MSEAGGGDLVRVSDADRDRAVASLREHLAQGRLTLEEFVQRMDDAYLAKTAAELAALEVDLPASAAALPERRRSAVRNLVAVFGATKRGGTLRVSERLRCVAVFGAVELDLRGALLEGDEIYVNAGALFGAVDVIVPEGVEIDLTGLAVFGAKETTGKTAPPQPGAPLVHVHALVLFGATSVRIKRARQQQELEP